MIPETDVWNSRKPMLMSKAGAILLNIQNIVLNTFVYYYICDVFTVYIGPHSGPRLLECIYATTTSVARSSS